MKLRTFLDCNFCGQKFETVSGINTHRLPNSLTCMNEQQLKEAGWTQKPLSGAWRRPKGRRT